MKRLILAIAVAMSAFCAMAQEQPDSILDPGKDPSWNRTGFFASANVGVASRKDSNSDFGFGIGLGFRWYFGGGFSWEVARVSYILSSDHFSENSAFQFSSALRFDTPRFKFLGYRPIYICESIGYNVSTSKSIYNCASNEFVVGIKITPKLSVGIFYINNWGDITTDDPYLYFEDPKYSWGMAGVKLDILLK